MNVILRACCAAALLLAANSTLAEAPYDLAWSRQLGTSGHDFAYSVAVDALGNAYLCGNTEGNLGGAHFGEIDALLIKYDSAGNSLWSRQFGGLSGEEGKAVTVDFQGNVLMTGGTYNEIGGPNKGVSDTYLVKFSDSGALLWSSQIGSSSYEISNAVTTDTVGNAYIGGTTYGKFAGNNAGQRDAIMAKYASGGNVLWTRQFGSTFNDDIRSMQVAPDGSFFVAGHTEGSLFATNAGGVDMFVAKFDSAGNQIWGRQLGSTAYDRGYSVAVDSLGNAYIAGATEGTITGPNGSAAGGFLMKYNAAGDLQWVQQLVDSPNSTAASVAVDLAGNPFVAGSIYASGGSDAQAFLSKCDSAGTFLWTQQFGSSGDDTGYSVAWDPLGSTYVAGYTEGDFAAPNAGTFDAFLAKFSPVPEPSSFILTIPATFFACRFWRRKREPRTKATPMGNLILLVTKAMNFGARRLRRTECRIGELKRVKIVCALSASSLLLIAKSANCETPYSLSWIRQTGTSQLDHGFSVAVDAAGNPYLAGITGGALAGSSFGENDAFLIKYDGLGNSLWSRQIGTLLADESRGVAVDLLGNSYVAGTTGGELAGSTAGHSDAFLIKHAPNGSELWKRQIGTSSPDGAMSVATDQLNNVFMTGLTWGSFAAPTAGESDAVLIKYNAAGDLLWSRQLGTANIDQGWSVATDANGNSFICGYTEGSLGGPNAGSVDAFVAKYSEQGDLLWSRQLGSLKDDRNLSVAVDSLGNAYLTGNTAGVISGPNGDVSAGFILKYDTAGNLQWLRPVGNNSDGGSDAIAVDGVGNSYVVGSSLTAAFLAKFDPAGDFLWSQGIGTIEQVSSYSVALDPFGNAFVGGIAFGDLAAPNAGQTDAFIAKFSPVPEPAAIIPGILGVLFALLIAKQRIASSATQRIPVSRSRT
jgi:hypothetical protein